MTYELAKELKDAGFLQRTLGDYDGQECGHEEGEHTRECRVACPTLSELIEACGEDFSSLTLTKTMWRARAANFIRMGELVVDAVSTIPEEAVARLWLALNRPIEE